MDHLSPEAQDIMARQEHSQALKNQINEVNVPIFTDVHKQVYRRATTFVSDLEPMLGTFGLGLHIENDEGDANSVTLTFTSQYDGLFPGEHVSAMEYPYLIVHLMSITDEERSAELQQTPAVSLAELQASYLKYINGFVKEGERLSTLAVLPDILLNLYASIFPQAAFQPAELLTNEEGQQLWRTWVLTEDTAVMLLVRLEPLHASFVRLLARLDQG